MINALTEEKNPPINGFLIDRHVAVASLERFKEKTLEIGRTVDYDYYIGMSVTPPQNSTQICDMIKKCAADILNSKDFERTALQVIKISRTKSLILTRATEAFRYCTSRHSSMKKLFNSRYSFF